MLSTGKHQTSRRLVRTPCANLGASPLGSAPPLTSFSSSPTWPVLGGPLLLHPEAAQGFPEAHGCRGQGLRTQETTAGQAVCGRTWLCRELAPGRLGKARALRPQRRAEEHTCHRPHPGGMEGGVLPQGGCEGSRVLQAATYRVVVPVPACVLHGSPV